MKQKTVIFHHIPKTGGTTMDGILEEYFEPEKLYSVNNWQGKHESSIENFKKKPIEILQNIQLVKGHNVYGLDDYLPNECQYFTMLRAPFSKIVSGYNHLRSTPAITEERKQFLAQNQSLEEFIEGGHFIYGHNIQLKRFLFLEDKTKKITSADFEEAKRNLERDFAIVGLMEKYDETIALLNLEFDWNIKGYQKKNVRKYKKTQPKELHDLYKKYNEYDILFYEFGKELFEKKCREYGSDFDKKNSEFKRSKKRFNQKAVLKNLFSRIFKIRN